MASQQTSGPMRRRSVASGASAVPALKGRGTLQSAGRGERSPNGTRRRVSHVFRSRPSAWKRSTEVKYRRAPPPIASRGSAMRRQPPVTAARALARGREAGLGFAAERRRRTAEHAGPDLPEQAQGGGGRPPGGSRQPAVDESGPRE